MEEPESEIRSNYKNRVNDVFQYIDQNLGANLSLEVLSEVACFSPFHFHRIFRTITGETLNEYMTRRRVEKAALDLIHKRDNITEIALKYGFNDISSFSRTFKKYYGEGPTAFRKNHTNRFSKIRQIESKNGQAYPDHEKYLRIINHLKNWTTMNANIKVKDMPPMELAYVTTIGTENLNESFQKIIRWATPKGLMTETAKMMTIYHDSLKVTEAHKARTKACILIEDEIKLPDLQPDGEIRLTTLAKGRFMIGSYEIGIADLEKAWTGLFIHMNEQGYKKADRDPFEIYYNDFNKHPEKKIIIDLCIPVA